MIIQWILIAGLVVSLCYAFLQRRKSRLVSKAIAVVALAGIYLVLFPTYATIFANYLGVGRGADLITYCWILISLAISLNLQFKILELQSNVTELTRELALSSAFSPDNIGKGSNRDQGPFYE